MSVLSDNYKKIIQEIEEKITNPEELEFVKEKMSELSMIFMEIIDKLSNMTEEKIKQIEARQEEIDKKMDKVQKSVNEIETDIYDEDEAFEFEIVCPYCNYEFIAKLDEKENTKKEIKCPECNNIIELDWNDEEDEDGCTGHCSECSGCSDEDNDEDEQDNEDDM